MSQPDFDFIFSNTGGMNWASMTVVTTTNTTNITTHQKPSPSTFCHICRYEQWLKGIVPYLEQGREIDILTGGVL